MRRSPVSPASVPAAQRGAHTARHGAQRSDIVGCAPADPGGGLADVAVHQAAGAGREDVHEVPRGGPAIVAGEAGQAHVDGPLAAARQCRQVGVETVLQAQRASEVAARAGGDQPEAWRALCAGFGARLHEPVHDLVQRAVAANRDHRVVTLQGAAARQVDSVAAACRVGDLNVAESALDGRQHLREPAARARPPRARIDYQQWPAHAANAGRSVLACPVPAGTCGPSRNGPPGEEQRTAIRAGTGNGARDVRDDEPLLYSYSRLHPSWRTREQEADPVGTPVDRKERLRVRAPHA